MLFGSLGSCATVGGATDILCMQEAGQDLPQHYSLKTAISFWGLDRYHVLWEQSGDTKVCLHLGILNSGWCRSSLHHSACSMLSQLQ